MKQKYIDPTMKKEKFNYAHGIKQDVVKFVENIVDRANKKEKK